jgi:hypothetical protein
MASKMIVSTKKNSKIESFEEPSPTNNEVSKITKESDMKTLKRHILLAMGISFSGNQVLTKRFAQLLIKQNPSEVIKVPARKKK